MTIETDEVGNFLGHTGDCEHRTVGPHRAWCFNCTEWCYPRVPCLGCERANMDKSIEWLCKELPYVYEKWGRERPQHDANMKALGASAGSVYIRDMDNYIHRAFVLGLDNPLGRQALAKGFAVYQQMLESVIRVYGPLPQGGYASGEIHE